MTSIKKFGLGSLVAALFAVMAFATLASTAYADVTAVSVNQNVAEPGDVVDVTATIDEATDGDTVTFRILASSSADGEWEMNGEQVIVCELDIDGTPELIGADCEGDAAVVVDDGGLDGGGTVTIEVEVDNSSPEGELDILVTHLGVGTDVTIFVVAEGVGDVDSIDIIGPASIEEDGEVNLRIVAFDDDDDRIVEDLVVVLDGDGELSVDGTDCVRLVDETGTDDECDISTTTSSSAASQAGVGLRATGDAGDTISITAYGFGPSGVPVFETLEIVIADDDVASLTIEAPATAAIGSASDVTITALDENDNPVPDGTVLDIDTTAGVIACEDDSETDDGVVSCTFVAPGSAQTVVLTAVADGTVATANIAVSGTGTTPPEPTEGFDRPIADIGVNTAIWGGGTVTELAAATAAAGGISVTVFVGGDAKVLIPGAPAFVNAEFNAAFPGGVVPDGTIVLVVR